jgi:hypothetical protein
MVTVPTHHQQLVEVLFQVLPFVPCLSENGKFLVHEISWHSQNKYQFVLSGGGGGDIVQC